MNILIIGSGGREHALAWKIAQNSQVKNVYVAPGNGGTATEHKTTNVAIDPLDFPALIQFCNEHSVSLTIVGPEAPLAAGIVDRFTDAGLACFGPNQAAAQLEASKDFSKAFMQRHNIPTAAYATFTDATQAKTYLSQQDYPIVIKADGLAAGKGVVIADNEAQAHQCIDDMMQNQSLGIAGDKVVIEEFLRGEEASFIVITDGQHMIPLASSQDHKARDDGDQGPNTGGMGAYSPAAIVDTTMQQRIIDEVINPTIAGMSEDGHPFSGFLYAGVMIDDNDEINVLEYNCRFGDPETQAVLFRLQSDLVELIQASLDNNLQNVACQWHNQPAVTVVMASKGYPAHYEKGHAIKGLEPLAANNDVKVFHAGTQLVDQEIITSGGRVLAVTALADSVKAAQEKCYQAINAIDCDQLFYRHDIGYRAIAREQ